MQYHLPTVSRTVYSTVLRIMNYSINTVSYLIGSTYCGTMSHTIVHSVVASMMQYSMIQYSMIH